MQVQEYDQIFSVYLETPYYIHRDMKIVDSYDIEIFNQLEKARESLIQYMIERYEEVTKDD
jgi:hypothetical protein